MMLRACFRMLAGLCLLMVSGHLSAAEKALDDKSALEAIQKALSRKVLAPGQALQEMQAYCRANLIPLPQPKTVAEWEAYTANLRQQIFEKVIYRGEAAKWKDLPTEPVWLETIPGGPGYSLKKVRFEAVPGMWVPAILYVPDKLSGKVPVVMAVNGHDRNGKAADYKQMRCINLVKRGMLVLNLEWLNMGQLRSDDFNHARMNQLDLCGTSGIAPFYLSMKRGLDILLAHPNADPKRVAVSGLSGGGWQTIFISSLDTRVTLCNPVAGYSAFETRIDHAKDLGDSEQTPVDLAKFADYTHLTALLAPRAALLTYNAKDECCFEAGYALPPLVAAAQPFYELYGKKEYLRTHINHDPGTHNYLKENREAYYKMIGDFFYAGDKNYIYPEIPCENEFKTAAQLHVVFPEPNAGFNTLALQIAKTLPRDPLIPTDSKENFVAWRDRKRTSLQQITRKHDLIDRANDDVKLAEAESTVSLNDLTIGHRRLGFKAAGMSWTFPIVEVHTKKWAGSAQYPADIVLLSERKPAELADFVVKQTANGKNLWLTNVSGFNECEIPTTQYLFSMVVASQGRRPLDLAARQLEVIAEQAAGCASSSHRLKMIAKSPRACLVLLNAVATSPMLARRVELELHDCRGSLKEILENNVTNEGSFEFFTFGLLEQFDILQIAALCAPTPVTFVNPSERVRKELAPLRDVYKVLGSDHDPLAELKK